MSVASPPLPTAQPHSRASESAPRTGFGDPALDARWGAWVAKDQRHEQTVQGRVRIVASVTPDVYIVKVEDHYVAELNDDSLPHMRISPVYRRLLDRNADHTVETRAYVRNKCRSALWLIKSVELRQKTIRKVATSLINFKRDFLDDGVEHLRVARSRLERPESTF